MIQDWMEECDCYGNHHEMFHIVQNNLKKDDLTNALEKIMGKEGWVADGVLTEDGAYFSTAKEDIESIAKQLSIEFPEATVFGQDCWDCEGYIVCYENGQKSTNYNASFSTFNKDTDEPDYYEVDLIINTKTGYQFSAGGGMVYKDEVKSMQSFIDAGTGDYEKTDIER